MSEPKPEVKPGEDIVKEHDPEAESAEKHKDHKVTGTGPPEISPDSLLKLPSALKKESGVQDGFAREISGGLESTEHELEKSRKKDTKWKKAVRTAITTATGSTDTVVVDEADKDRKEKRGKKKRDKRHVGDKSNINLINEEEKRHRRQSTFPGKKSKDKSRPESRSRSAEAQEKQKQDEEELKAKAAREQVEQKNYMFYLETGGCRDLITMVLMKLYDEPHKPDPEDVIGYFLSELFKLGVPSKLSAELEEMKSTLRELTHRLENLQLENERLKSKLDGNQILTVENHPPINIIEPVFMDKVPRHLNKNKKSLETPPYGGPYNSEEEGEDENLTESNSRIEITAV